jgi:uncharacterized membrane protein YedE/YeeE
MKKPSSSAFLVFVAALAALSILAAVTMWWPLTAVAIGLAFGFTLQRGRFCGAAILSSVVLLKERDGVIGAGLAIGVAMIGFAAMNALGWIEPNPKRLLLLPAIVGGLLFGVGMVFAGGCVTGSLFKAGEGRLGSILAVLGVAIGSTAMAAGALTPVREAAASVTSGLSAGPGIFQVASVSFPLLAGPIGLVTVGVLGVVAWKRRKARGDRPLLQRLAGGGWSFASAGAVLGALGWLTYLASADAGRNYPLGATEGVFGWTAFLVGGRAPMVWWMMVMTTAMVAGSSVSAWLRGELSLKSADGATLIVSLLGGVLVGAGAVLGQGCFVGHGLSGWALLSIQSLIFGVCMILANWATTIVYLRGLR